MNPKKLSLFALVAALFAGFAFGAPLKASEEAVNKALKLADKSPVNAIPLLEAAEKNYPFHSANQEVLYQLSMAYVDAGRYEDANKTLDKLVARYGKYADTIIRVDEAKVAKSHVLRAQGKYDEALAYVQKFIAENPKSIALNSAKLELANVLVKKGKYDEAEKLVANFAKNPNNDLFLPASYVLAEISVRKGDSDNAEKRMLAILKTNNNKDIRTTTYYKLGEIYRGCSNYVGAISIYRRIKTPGKTKDDRAANAGILWEIAGTYESLGHFLEARVGFEAVMDKYPEVEFSTQAWFRAVLCDISASDYARAEKNYLDFIKKYPGHPDAAGLRLAMAQSLMETNRFDEAVRNLRAGLTEYKEGEPAENMYFTLGSALLGAKKYAEAEKTLGEFAEKFQESPLVPQSYLKLAEGYIEQQKFAEAAEFLKKTTEQFPAFAQEYKLEEYAQEIILAQAAAEAEAKNYAKAQELCGQITLERLLEQANYLKADMMVKQGNVEEGAKLLASMVDQCKDPKMQADILNVLASVYMQNKDYPKAQTTLDRVLALALPEGNAQKPAAALQKAFCCYYAGDEAGMKTQLEAVLNGYPKAQEAGDALYWLAYLKRSDRKYLEAADYYARLVKDYPTHGFAPEAAYETAENNVLANKYLESLPLFRKAYDTYPETGYGALSLVRIGEIRMQQNDEVETWKDELTALGTPAAKVALLALAVRAGDKEAASKDAKNVKPEKCPEEIKGYAYAMLAGEANLRGEYKEAGNLAQKAIDFCREAGVNLDEALFQMAEARYLYGDKESPVPYYDEMLENFVVPNASIKITALLHRGECALDAKDPAMADKCGQDILGLKPQAKQSAAAVLMRARACELTSTYKQAAQYYKRVTVLYGKMPEFAVPAYRGLIKAYAKLDLKNELAEAKEQFKARYPEEAAK